MNILIVKGESSHRIIPYLSDCVHGALQRLGPDLGIGVDCVQLDVQDLQNSLAKVLEKIKSENFDTVLTFNAFFGNMVNDTGHLFDLFDVRYITLLVDHPLYQYTRIIVPLKKRVTIASQEEHLKFLQGTPPSGQMFCQLAGVEDMQTPLKPWDKRDFDLVIAATYWEGDNPAVWQDWPSELERRFFSQLADRLVDNPFASLEQTLSETCQALHFTPSLDLHFYGKLQLILTWLRKRDRFNAVKSLLASDLKLAIVGSGWDQVFALKPHQTLYPNRPFADMAEIYANARIGVNINAGNGACERFFSALICKTAVVSEHNPYLVEHYGADQGVLYFPHGNGEALVAAAAEILSDPGVEARAEAGRNKVRQRDLWTHRAFDMVQSLITQNLDLQSLHKLKA